VIAKGNTNAHGGALARYMMTPKEGERVEVGEVRGFETKDLYEALRTVQLVAGLTKAEQPFFHVYVRLPEGERITRERWFETADRLGKVNALEKQPRGIMFHVDKETGDEHMHVVWSRIDIWNVKAVPLPKFATKMIEETRRIELDFGITQVRSRRDYNELQAPTRTEQEQARRLGLTAKQHDSNRADIRVLYHCTNNGQEFAAALPENGLMLARGDRRPLVVVDERGCPYALGKRILGVKQAEVLEKLGDLDAARLPSIREAAAALQKARTATRRERALQTSMQAGIDERAFYTHSKEEQARARAKLETAQTRKGTEAEVLTRVNERLRGEEIGTTPGSSATQGKGEKVQDQVYDREAEAVRQATALIDGAAKAAPEIARRQDAEAKRDEVRAAAKAEVFAPEGSPTRIAALYDPARAQRDFATQPKRAQAKRPPEPVYDREAEAVREATALIDGAAKAAPAIVAREKLVKTEQRAAVAATARSPEGQRIGAVLAAVSGDPWQLFEAQRLNQVVFAREGGRVVVVTSREANLLTHDESQRVLAAFNARDRGQPSQRALDGFLPEASTTEQFQAAQLPTVPEAQRMAYGLERRAAFERTVTEAFAATMRAQDGGTAFVEGLTANGMKLDTDQARRLHVVGGDRKYRLDQFVADRDQEKYIPAFVARKPATGPEMFKSFSDNRDERAQKWERIAEERLVRQVKQVAHQAVAEPARPVATGIGKAVTVASAPARAVGKAVQGIGNLVTGFGKFEEQQQAASAAPAPARAAARVPPPVPAALAAVELKRQNTTALPDEHTKQLAKANPGALQLELKTRLDHLEEQNKKANDERAPDGERVRYRSPGS
jgi:hypothetical protein